MSSTNFRVESFRPWNPSQAKSRTLRESPGTCRYPSPVSITAASPPLNPNKVGIRSIEIDTHKVERHPLPSRPPTEVCLEGQHSETQVTRSESVGVGRTPSAINYPETVNLDNTTQPQHTVDIDDVAFTRSADNLPQEADLQYLNLGWHDSELVDFDRQEPHTVDSGCVNRQAEQDLNIEAIDPAVLSNCDPPATEQAQMTEGINGIAVYPEGNSAISRRFQGKASPRQSRRQCPKKMMGTWCPSKTTKTSCVRKRHMKESSGPSNKISGARQSNSSAKICAQFSALPVEDRIEFLSWLFEGALTHCALTSSNTNVSCPSGSISSYRGSATFDSEHRSLNIESDEMQHNSSRKGLQWSMEEDHLLVQLRDERNLPWSEVAKQFSQRFPGRSQGAIQVYWSTSHKNRK